MDDHQKLLIVTICLYIAGIGMILLGVAQPYLYENVPWYPFRFYDKETTILWGTISWIFFGVVALVVATLMTLMLLGR
jgi:hypothetical protein